MQASMNLHDKRKDLKATKPLNIHLLPCNHPNVPLDQILSKDLCLHNMKLVQKNIANFDILMLDILIFLNLDHGFNFRYELDHFVRSSEIKYYFIPLNTLNAKNLVILTVINFFWRFFLMWSIFKVFIEFVTILRMFYVLVFLATRDMGS